MFQIFRPLHLGDRNFNEQFLDEGPQVSRLVLPVLFGLGHVGSSHTPTPIILLQPRVDAMWQNRASSLNDELRRSQGLTTGFAFSPILPSGSRESTSIWTGQTLLGQKKQRRLNPFGRRMLRSSEHFMFSHS